MSLYELNKKLENTRQNGFIFNQVNDFKIKNCKILSNIFIEYYLNSKYIVIF